MMTSSKILTNNTKNKKNMCACALKRNIELVKFLLSNSIVSFSNQQVPKKHHKFIPGMVAIPN